MRYITYMKDVLKYYIALLGRHDIGAYLSLALAGFILLLALFGALKGIFRGLGRQAVRLITIGASAVLAFLGTTKIYPLVVGIMRGKTVLQLLRFARLDGIVQKVNAEIFELISTMDATATTDVLTLPMAVAIIPFVFVALFVLISAFMLILHACLAGILGYTYNNNTVLTRILGAILGFAQGAFVAVMILIPVSGLMNVATEAVERSATEDGKVTVLYERYLEEAAQSPINRVITRYGGDLVYRKLTTVSLDGTQRAVDAREPVYNLLVIYDKWMSLESADFSNLSAEEREALTDMLEIMGEDPYIARILSSIVRTMVSSDGIRYTLTAGSFEEPFRGYFDEWLTVYESATADTLTDDLDTLLDVLYIMIDNDVLAAFITHNGESMRQIFITADENGETVITKIVERFRENPRTAQLVTTLARLSLTLMADESDLSLDGETLDTFNSVKEDLANTLLALDKDVYGENIQEYEKDVAAALDAALTENGIALDADIIDGMAKYVSDNNERFDALAELDDAALCDILISYYGAYAEATAN